MIIVKIESLFLKYEVKTFWQNISLSVKIKLFSYAKSGVLSSDSSLIVEFEACVTMTVGFV